MATIAHGPSGTIFRSVKGQRQAGGESGDLRPVNRTFTILVVVGALAGLMYAIMASDSWTVRAGIFGSAALISGAFALIGGLVGFIFAIPRSRQEREVQVTQVTTENDGTRHRLSDYAANTNLEQISDWLTKILVGVGLTQFDAMSARFTEAATALAPLLGTGEAARPATLALMTYFMAWGFFCAYLLTRLWLPKALSRAEREEETRQREADLQVQREAELRALERKAYEHLYEAPPGGFTRAIETVETYQASKGALPSAWLWLYLAAAYGQKHSSDQAQNPDQAEWAREKAIEAVKAAIDMNPTTRPILERLYLGTDPSENDLASLKGDPRLEELFGIPPR